MTDGEAPGARIPGRALHREMHPFMAGELALAESVATEAAAASASHATLADTEPATASCVPWASGPRFDLDAALRLGMIPSVVASDDPRSTLAAYAALYVEQVVRAEGLARDIGSFSRFLEAVSFSHAATLNIAEVARECETSRTTVAGYIELLEDLLLAFRLPVFTRRAKRRLIAHPRFFYVDCGVFRSLRPRGPLDRPAEIAGPALEGLVAQHLRAWIAYSGTDARLHYWRTRAGSEVDFVLYGGSEFWAVDVMNAPRVRPADLRGLGSFGGDYPEAERVLLYRGRERLLRNGVLCLPVEDFLLGLRPDRSLAEAVRKARPATAPAP